jgi:hypothetical protein
VFPAKKVAVTNLCQAGQVNERQAEDVRGVDLQVDGLPVDALVVSCYSRRLVLDLALDVGEVVEPLAGDVEELAPFLLAGYTGWCVGHVDLVVVVFVAFAREVDELEDERPAGDDAAATGKEVLADNVLEHRGFSRRL